MDDLRIQVDGLKELQSALRTANRAFPKYLRAANKTAADVVADATRSSFASRGGVAPKVAASVKALAQQRNASVKIGGKRYPYALGAEFGGGKYGKGHPSPAGGHTTQFPPWRGNGGTAGYSLFPSIRRKRAEVLEVHAKAVDQVTRTAFPD